MAQTTARILTLDSTRAETGPEYFEMEVTPALAEEWLGSNIGNRHIRDAKVRMYARDMAAGDWRSTGESIKFDWSQRLIDGQHRLLAVIASGSTVRLLIARGLTPDAQRFLDTGAKRSAADALRMAGERSNQALIAAAVRVLIAYDEGTLRTSASRPAERSNAEILDWYEGKEEALASAALTARRVAKVTGAMTSVVVAFTYLTTRKDALASFQFLSDLENLRTEGKGDPRYTLILRLQRIRDYSERTSQAQQLYYFLRAWNAWREKKTLHGMKDSALGAPTSIPEPK